CQFLFRAEQPLWAESHDPDDEGSDHDQSERCPFRRLQKRERRKVEKTCSRKQKTEDKGAHRYADDAADATHDDDYIAKESEKRLDILRAEICELDGIDQTGKSRQRGSDHQRLAFVPESVFAKGLRRGFVLPDGFEHPPPGRAHYGGQQSS